MLDHATESTNGGPELTLQQRRLLDGQCTRCGTGGPHETNECSGCAKSAVDRNRARRAKLRENGKCVRCGRRSKNYRCRRCEKTKRAQRRGQTRARLGHTAKPPLPTKIEVRTEADGYERTRVRYTGRATRGAPSNEQLALEQVRNVRFARRELDKLERVLSAAAAATHELPVIQREGAWQNALGLAGLAGRLLESVEDHIQAQIKRLPGGKRTSP